MWLFVDQTEHQGHRERVGQEQEGARAVQPGHQRQQGDTKGVAKIVSKLTKKMLKQIFCSGSNLQEHGSDQQ